ncbi:MAG: MBL fold metallo-hydrolase [Halobaculum sp.]
MSPGDVRRVPDHDVHYVDTGMYETAAYGAVYVIDAERPAVIDTGIGTHVDLVTDALEELGVVPELILPTHVHLDHAGGAGFLAEQFPDATVLTHERGVPHLIDPERLIEGTKRAVGDQWEFYVEPRPVPEDRIEGVTDGDRLDLGDRTLTVHHAPGHAPHQVLFEDSDAGLVFTADAAGIYVPALDTVRPTTPPPQFDLDQALADVDTIRDLEPETLCFAHFGPHDDPETVLPAYKRTLIEWVEAVRQRYETEGDREATVAHFADTVDRDLITTWGARKASEEARLNARGVLESL